MGDQPSACDHHRRSTSHEPPAPSAPDSPRSPSTGREGKQADKQTKNSLEQTNNLNKQAGTHLTGSLKWKAFKGANAEMKNETGAG